MANRDEINRLRAELIRRQAAAGKKISRTKRENRVDIAGSALDPRADKQKIGKYTVAQLRSRLDQVNTFIDRKTQFYGLRNGQVATREQVQRFRTAEGRFNKRYEADLAGIGDLVVPHTGMTIKDYDKQMRPSVKAAGERNARIYEPVSTKIHNIDSLEALDTFTETRLRQATPEYKASRIAGQRVSLDKMLARVGEEDMRARISYWTDDQFYVFWNYGHNAEDAGLWYLIEKESDGKEKEEADRNRVESINNEFKDIFNWIESDAPSDIQARAIQKRSTNKRRK